MGPSRRRGSLGVAVTYISYTYHAQVRSSARQWGVRSVATHGGAVVVAGGDDGNVHVWTLAEKGKADGGDGTLAERAGGEGLSGEA